MDLPAILGDHSPSSVDRRAAYAHIRDNAVARRLRGRGYRFVQLQSTAAVVVAVAANILLVRTAFAYVDRGTALCCYKWPER
jgi:hypothetical protein